MSEDVEAATREKAECEQRSEAPVGGAGCSDIDEEEREKDCLQLLPEEELVPLSQSLITPTLARLFDLNTPPSAPPQRFPCLAAATASTGERLHSHYVELQQMQQLQEDDMIRGIEDDDSRAKPNVDEPCRMHIMMGNPLLHEGKGRTAGAGLKRSHANAGLSDGYNMQICDADGADDHTEGFGMNHLVERENSSNSGDGGAGSGGGGAGSGGARTLKRPRLVWTPQLHKRFVDAVSHLGIKNAVPKTIMQLMNVEGLTRENVASHLQKYRLYLRRVQQGSLFSSCPGTSPTKSILGGLASDHPHHHHPLMGAAAILPAGAGNADCLFSSSEIASNNLALNNHRPHTHSALHRLPGPNNHLIPGQHIPNLLLQPVPQQQLNQAMALVKSPPSFSITQHLDPRRYTATTVNPSPIKKAAWPSPHASLMDISAVHHVENHGSTTSSSPPRRALTLFPH